MRKQLAEDLAAALRDASDTVDALRDIHRVAVCSYSCDARGALMSGAVLLCVTPAPKTTNGDGFLYLVGLPRGEPITPYLSSVFGE